MPLVILAPILEVMMGSVGGVGPTILESNLHLGILATSGLRHFVRFCIILRQLWSNDVGGQPATSLATWNSGAESFNLLIAIYLGNFIGSTLAAYIVSEAKTFATSGLPDWCQNWYTGRQTTDYEWMGRRYHLRQSVAHDRRQKPRSRFNWMDLLYNNTFCVVQSYTLSQGSDLFYTVGARTGLEPNLGWTH